MGRLLRFSCEKPLTKPLVLAALQIVIISALFSFYNVQIPIQPAFNWIQLQIYKVPLLKNSIQTMQHYLNPYFQIPTRNTQQKKHPTLHSTTVPSKPTVGRNVPIFTPEQLALFDGSRASKPVYLAILGQVFNVDKGRKHYGQGGGYHFFAGKDATRAFVTGDFTQEGLTDDVTGLSEQELLSINDWMAFYAKDYQFVGFLSGLYYDQAGKPTEYLEQVKQKIENAKAWKQRQIGESEVFPPCNSEWKKDVGGRVWCSSKSGGISRDWVGVPRKLFNPSTKNHRCVCVKNHGPSLSAPDVETNRGDLDNPNLREYDECPPTANSCKLPAA